MVSGPTALNSSSPTLATRKYGWSWRARRMATTRSSTSSAKARWSRAAGPTVADVSVMCSSDDVVEIRGGLVSHPLCQFFQHPGRRAWIGERGGADLHRGGPRQQELGGVLA